MRETALAILVAIGAALATPVFAADLPTKKPAPAIEPAPAIPSTWRFEFTGYGWASSIAGNAGYGRLPTLSYYASFGKILEHFEGGLMGAAVVRNDTFIGGLDFIWSRIGVAGTVRDPASNLFGVGTDVTLNEGVVTGFGGIRVPLGMPNLELYGTVGARYFYSGTKVTLTSPVPGFSLTSSVNKDWIDPVTGFVAHYRFNDRWFMNVVGDLGGWSDSATGQALASVGYNWTANIATTLGYRVLYTYAKQNTGFETSFRYQQWLYGPFAGFKVSF